jgi:surface polysaccharide O-acyltransferase-like enzyme
MSTQRQFQQHIHVFRAVAITLIVCAHSLPTFDWTANPWFFHVMDGIANESSIYFFFIAGYLFQHLSARFDFKRYLWQKIKTVILPYLILSIPAIIVYTFLLPRGDMWPWFYGLPAWQKASLFLLTGKHLAPLWFVPTITLFYLVAPVFIYIDKKQPRLYWSIIAFTALAMYLGRGGHYGPLNKAIYLLPIYMSGMWFCHYQDRAEALVRKYWIPLLMVSMAGLAGYVLQWTEPPQYLMIMKMPLAALLVIFLKKYHNRVGHRLDYIAHVSFGIFFVHAYFIGAFKVALAYATQESPTLRAASYATLVGTPGLYFAFAALVLVASVVLIWLAQKVLGDRSRMFIGA